MFQWAIADGKMYDCILDNGIAISWMLMRLILSTNLLFYQVIIKARINDQRFSYFVWCQSFNQYHLGLCHWHYVYVMYHINPQDKQNRVYILW